MEGMDADYYEILGVDHDASHEEIKKAYRTAMRDAHPDKPSGGAWQFRMVQTAWRTLGNEDKRRLYDERLKGPSNSQPAPEQASQPSQETQQEAPEPQQPQTSQSPQTSAQPSGTQQSSVSPQPPPRDPTAPDIDDVLNMQQAPASEPSPVQHEEAPQPIENIHLKKWKFIPSLQNTLYLLIGGLAFALVMSGANYLLLSDFTEFEPALIFAGVGFAALGIITRLIASNSQVNIAGVVMMILGVLVPIIPMLIDDQYQGGMYLFSTFGIGIGIGVSAYGGEGFSKNLKLTKLIPTKMLRQSRVFGTPIGASVEESVVMRNLADQITPITQTVNGTFLLHVSGTPINENEITHTKMVVLHGNTVCLVSFIGSEPGMFDVDQTGNIIRTSAISGQMHIENYNPMVLQGVSVIEKEYKNLDVYSLVVIAGQPGSQTPNENKGKTIITTEYDAVKDLKELFNEEETVVRRDVIHHYLPAITSTG